MAAKKKALDAAKAKAANAAKAVEAAKILAAAKPKEEVKVPEVLQEALTQPSPVAPVAQGHSQLTSYQHDLERAHQDIQKAQL